MSTLTTLVGAAVVGTCTVAQVDGIAAAHAWATAALEDIRVNEQARQQQVQDVVCELNGTAPGDCPRIVLKRTVINDPLP